MLRVLVPPPHALASSQSVLLRAAACSLPFPLGSIASQQGSLFGHPLCVCIHSYQGTVKEGARYHEKEEFASLEGDLKFYHATIRYYGAYLVLLNIRNRYK